MIRVVTFSESKNLGILENFLSNKGLPYVLQKTTKEIYFENCLGNDINQSDVILLVDDIIELKREIRIRFSLKNEVCKFLPRNEDIYFTHSTSSDDILDSNSSFERCTFPQGFHPIDKNGMISFAGKINNFWLMGLLDSKEELAVACDFISNAFADLIINKTMSLRMFFEDDSQLKLLHETLDDLKCRGFTWKIINDSCGLYNLYLYFTNDLHDSSIAHIENVIRAIFNENIYADFDITLPEILLHLASVANLKISSAESLTAGLIADTIVSVSGASKIFDCALVTYSNEAKVKLLGVDEDVIATHGAVSDIVAKQMALGLREKYGCDIGLSATGIAGPTGQTKEKPVGLVYIGISTPDKVISYKCLFKGDREQVRCRTANFALFKLLKVIKNF